MDGTHINCCPSADFRHLARDRKGGVTQNTLACCGFDLRFQYILSGMDGCTADASMYNDAHLTDLKIPVGKYYLADAGFGICDSLLVPFRGVRYHLAEWGRASVRYVICALNMFVTHVYLPLSDLSTRKNFSIFDMLLHEMLSNGFLVSSSVGLSSLYTHPSTPWTSNLVFLLPLLLSTTSFEIMIKTISLILQMLLTTKQAITVFLDRAQHVEQKFYVLRQSVIKLRQLCGGVIKQLREDWD